MLEMEEINMGFKLKSNLCSLLGMIECVKSVLPFDPALIRINSSILNKSLYFQCFLDLKFIPDLKRNTYIKFITKNAGKTASLFYCSRRHLTLSALSLQESDQTTNVVLLPYLG